LAFGKLGWDAPKCNGNAINYSRKLLENSFISETILELIDGDGNLA
jgi:hypothetical protein